MITSDSQLPLAADILFKTECAHLSWRQKETLSLPLICSQVKRKLESWVKVADGEDPESLKTAYLLMEFMVKNIAITCHPEKSCWVSVL